MTCYSIFKTQKISTKKFLELIHKFIKVARYKINVQKYVAILYNITKQQKNKSRNQPHLQLQQKTYDS